jgi:NADH-quinone oxidoreductase subunit D
MIINMGPQHPSTHGVLRVMLELDAETIVRAKPVVGYLHTGMEKTGEELTYVQGATNVTRMDYASPLSNELVFSMAVERLLDIEVPPRATWIRMYLNELNRIASHLLVAGHKRLGHGRAVDDRLRLARTRRDAAAPREDHRPADETTTTSAPAVSAAELPDGWQDDTLELCDRRAGVAEYDDAALGEPDLARAHRRRRRDHHRGGAGAQRTGPILRSTGFAWDLRKAQPYLAYDDVDFDVIYTSNGDVFDRYRIRLYEILESVKIVRQCVERMPPATTACRTEGHAAAAARIDESMEALIHHFKLFTEGFQVPAGETYVAIESPRGEIGCYSCPTAPGSRAGIHIRGPSFYNLQSMDAMVPGGSSPTRSRSSRASIRSWGGRPLVAFTPRTSTRAARSVAQYPQRSRRSCRCCTSRRTRTAGDAEAIEEIADCSTSRPRSCSGRAPSTRCSSASRRAARRVGVHERELPRERRPELLEHLERRYATTTT